jgi:hypothetical protein
MTVEKARFTAQVRGKVIVPDKNAPIRHLLKEMEDLPLTPSRHYEAQEQNVLNALFSAHERLKELVAEERR